MNKDDRHILKSFREPLKRLKTIKPTLNALVAVTDFSISITDFILNKKSVFLMRLPDENIFLYKKLEGALDELTKGIAGWNFSILETGMFEKSAGETVSLILLLLTVQLKDMEAMVKNLNNLKEDEYSDFNVRSAEAYRIIFHLFFSLSNNVTSRYGPMSKLFMEELDIEFCISNLVCLYNKRSAEFENILMDDLLLTLEHSVKSSQVNTADRKF